MFLISNNLDKNCWSSIYENGNLFEDSETFWLFYDSIFNDKDTDNNNNNNSKFTKKFKCKINKIIDNSINNNLSIDESKFIINKIKKLLILYLITNPQLFDDEDESISSTSSNKTTTKSNKKAKSNSKSESNLKSEFDIKSKSESNEKDEIEELRKKLINNLNENKFNYNKTKVLKLTPFINNNSFSSYSYSFS
ncbi:unnamed protein product [[Candida] boidinii]|nr:unnamed protein product [[Candida] boidinii]